MYLLAWCLLRCVFSVLLLLQMQFGGLAEQRDTFLRVVNSQEEGGLQPATK